MMTSRAGVPSAPASGQRGSQTSRIGHEIGLVSDEQYEYVLWKEKAIEAEIARPRKTNIGYEREGSGVPGGSWKYGVKVRKYTGGAH